MLSVEQAIQAICESVEPAPTALAPLREASGLVLAEEVRASGDSPPFDKALMDGYAATSADREARIADFAVIGEITAGSTETFPVGSGRVVRIMTGATLPEGADCVIPFEQALEQADGASVRLPAEALRPGANLARRGASVRAGSLILSPGARLGAVQLGALAEMGRTEVRVHPRPRIAILATGDELVPFDTEPGPGQIRNSNELMLVLQASAAGADAVPLGIARDRREELESRVAQGLDADFLCLTGGVSAGTRDLVPDVLAGAGVTEVFHGCRLKPGKPVWFGRLPAERSADGQPRWIFGLPGNPVSSMVCFELFVRTALRRRMGIAAAAPELLSARLTSDHVSKDSRPTYFPALLSGASDDLCASPLDWRGSFDLQATARANGLILFSEPRTFAAGERVAALPLG
ncbi:MAG: molybdopterin molybdotransferase MoeA [Planctomyces sp.]|nr:molybdopterin molybdotransferase MoeA [Planctomyces sp.]